MFTKRGKTIFSSRFFPQGLISKKEVDEIHSMMNELAGDDDYEHRFRILGNTMNLYNLEGKDKVLSQMKYLIGQKGLCM